MHEINAVRELQKAGIKGIKYKAGQFFSLPEGAKPKAYNCVVFNPADAKIIEQKNLMTDENIKSSDGSDDNPSILMQESDILFQNEVPEDFSEQLDKITEQDTGRPDDVVIFTPETPFVFRKLGMPNLSVQMYVNKLAKGIFWSRTKKHGHSDSISKDVVRHIATHFADPAMVFTAASRADSLVAVYDIPQEIQVNENNLIVVSIAKEQEKSNRLIVNLITSIHGKDENKAYPYWLKDGLLRYIDDQKTRELTNRLYLPSTNSLADDNILTKSHLVNNFVTEEKRSPRR